MKEKIIREKIIKENEFNLIYVNHSSADERKTLESSAKRAWTLCYLVYIDPVISFFTNNKELLHCIVFYILK